MSKELDYDNVDWVQYFKLDSTSPSGLSWNRTLVTPRRLIPLIWPGKPAGSLGCASNAGKKCWNVDIRVLGDSKSRSYKVHRILMVLQGFKLKGKVVDHINGESSDNTLSNLRVTTIKANARNCKVQNNSPYGLSGVGLQTDSIGNSYFISRWMQDGKRIQLNFPISKLGVMEAFKQAVVSRQTAIARINNKDPDAMYTGRHTQLSGSFNP